MNECLHTWFKIIVSICQMLCTENSYIIWFVFTDTGHISKKRETGIEADLLKVPISVRVYRTARNWMLGKCRRTDILSRGGPPTESVCAAQSTSSTSLAHSCLIIRGLREGRPRITKEVQIRTLHPYWYSSLLIIPTPSYSDIISNTAMTDIGRISWTDTLIFGLYFFTVITIISGPYQ